MDFRHFHKNTKKKQAATFLNNVWDKTYRHAKHQEDQLRRRQQSGRSRFGEELETFGGKTNSESVLDQGSIGTT